VGVEIPNPKAEMVLLREILEAGEFARSRAELPLALGRDLTGKPYVADLAKMPHALIAGATGSGKSVCLNAFITSLVYRHTPETLRFLLIDPKMVELSAYVDLPHLRHPVVTDPRDAASILKWAVFEMENRYRLLSVNRVRSVGEFNKKLRQGVLMKRVFPRGPDGDPDRWIWRDGPIPYVVLVVDELADLMMTVQSEIEKPLTLLAQKARAIGIHLLVATQRPSVNVITGLIKANFPTRVAFRVASKTDSRTILDQNGADALLGNGDMLFLPPGTSEPVRIQGAFLSTDETERLVAWYRDQAALRAGGTSEEERWPEEEDILEVVRSLEAESTMEEGGLGEDAERDELFWEAAEVCVQQNQGSTSLLQRRLKVGYGRAARMVDQLHEAGVLGPPDGSKAREVLLTMSDLEFLRRGEEEEI
jgi:S-DNA-T family DNA segregation ATPase FtsK/SpoIIIE